MLTSIAAKLTVAGGKASPSPQAMGQFYEKIDSDDEWFPGKICGERRGRKRAIDNYDAAAIAKSAMTMKKVHNIEPTYSRLVIVVFVWACGPLASYSRRTKQNKRDSSRGPHWSCGFSFAGLSWYPSSGRTQWDHERTEDDRDVIKRLLGRSAFSHEALG